MKADQSPWPYASGALAVLVWGATPAATALVARDMPSALVGPARMLASAILLAPFALALRPRLPSDKGGWIALGVSAWIGFAASFVLQGLGIARTTTGHAALVLACTPVLTALAEFLLSRAWPRALWWLGSATALIGEATLILGRGAASRGAEPTALGDLIVLAGAITVSVGYVAGARLSSRIGLFAATSWSILFGAALLLPAAPALFAASAALTTTGAGALGVLALFCTLVGYAAWFWALSRGDVATMALLQYAQPIVSLAIAATLLSEEVSPSLVGALALILAGVALCRKAR
jgi:drug/metabolite transporter (DMT)-like permease